MKKLQVLIAFLFLIASFVSGCASKSSDCKQPDVFCVGLVTSVGRRDDRAYNQAAWEGIQQAKASGATDWIASIETVDARDYDENIAIFGDAGYDVIVTVGSAMSDATRAAAKTYPTSYFIGLDQDQSTGQDFSPNLIGLVFPEDQIGFLAGALASMMTKTGQVGAVCGSDVSLPMKRYGEGFIAGARYIDPKVEATVVYHNEVGLDKTFDDPEWGAKTANTLIDGGADIVFGVGGTTGSNAIVAAAMRGAYGIGADTDEYFTLPIAAPHLYASVLKMIAPDVANLIKIAKDAQTKGSVFPTVNDDGQIGLSPYHDLNSAIPEDVKARITKLTKALLDGDLTTGVSITNP
jgi:basic membrane protein A